MGVLLIRKNIFKKMVLQITLFSKIGHQSQETNITSFLYM